MNWRAASLTPRWGLSLVFVTALGCGQTESASAGPTLGNGSDQAETLQATPQDAGNAETTTGMVDTTVGGEPDQVTGRGADSGSGSASSHDSGAVSVDTIEVDANTGTADIAAADVVGDSAAGGALDDVLRINHIQAKGTHNSYHLKAAATTIPQWDYEFDPLATQLAKQGVRQLELDVHYKPGKPKATWEVLHVPFVDAKSNCPNLRTCLKETKQWSDKHPNHHLLFILIEPKDDLDTNKITGHYDELDEAILEVWPKQRLLRPDDVRGKHPSIRKALLADGWPTLGQTRGKAMFVMLNSGHHRTNYLKGHPNLEDRVIFMRDGEGEPWGCVLEMGDPIKNQAKIQDAVKAGYLVRSKADSPEGSDSENAKKATAALSSGAQIISCDHPVKSKNPKKNFVFDIPGGTPSRCNPLIAPKGCTSAAIE